VIQPHIRFKGEPGEQPPCLLKIQAETALEFKSFQDMSRVFVK